MHSRDKRDTRSIVTLPVALRVICWKVAGGLNRSSFAHDLRRLQAFALHAHAGWPVAVAHVISVLEVFLAGILYAVEFERVSGVASFPAPLDGERTFVVLGIGDRDFHVKAAAVR